MDADAEHKRIMDEAKKFAAGAEPGPGSDPGPSLGGAPAPPSSSAASPPRGVEASSTSPPQPSAKSASSVAAAAASSSSASLNGGAEAGRDYTPSPLQLSAMWARTDFASLVDPPATTVPSAVSILPSLPSIQEESSVRGGVQGLPAAAAGGEVQGGVRAGQAVEGLPSSWSGGGQGLAAAGAGGPG